MLWCDGRCARFKLEERWHLSGELLPGVQRAYDSGSVVAHPATVVKGP